MGIVFYPSKDADGAATNGPADGMEKRPPRQDTTEMRRSVSALAKTEADQTRVFAALSRLQLASDLIDQAGRGLAPFVPGACSEALLELSLELSRIEAKLGRRALGDAASLSAMRRRNSD